MSYKAESCEWVTTPKAGFWLDLSRWFSLRTIQETLLPTRDWRRPYLGSKG
jgi:hypothetical protein